MRFYTSQHQFYCGVDLHAMSLYLCIPDQSGAVLAHKNLPAHPEAFLQTVAVALNGRAPPLPNQHCFSVNASQVCASDFAGPVIQEATIPWSGIVLPLDNWRPYMC
jgi:hypothetical protein